jgi:hypothetical protein
LSLRFSFLSAGETRPCLCPPASAWYHTHAAAAAAAATAALTRVVALWVGVRACAWRKPASARTHGLQLGRQDALFDSPGFVVLRLWLRAVRAGPCVHAMHCGPADWRPSFAGCVLVVQGAGRGACRPTSRRRQQAHLVYMQQRGACAARPVLSGGWRLQSTCRVWRRACALACVRCWQATAARGRRALTLCLSFSLASSGHVTKQRSCISRVHACMVQQRLTGRNALGPRGGAACQNPVCCEAACVCVPPPLTASSRHTVCSSTCVCARAPVPNAGAQSACA